MNNDHLARMKIEEVADEKQRIYFAWPYNQQWVVIAYKGMPPQCL